MYSLSGQPDPRANRIAKPSLLNDNISHLQYRNDGRRWALAFDPRSVAIDPFIVGCALQPARPSITPLTGIHGTNLPNLKLRAGRSQVGGSAGFGGWRSQQNRKFVSWSGNYEQSCFT